MVKFMDKGLVELLVRLVQSYGYVGIFFMSMVSNSIPYVSLPYLAILVVMAPLFQMPALAVLSSALGATLGKVVILFLGRSFRRILSEETKENLKCFNALFRRWSFVAVFLFAASPLPDDVLYIPLGLSGYRLIPYFVAVFAGKVIVTSLAVVFGRAFVEVAHRHNIPFEVSLLLLVAVTVLVTYITVKVNWRNVVEAYGRGVGEGTRVFLQEVLGSLKLKR